IDIGVRARLGPGAFVSGGINTGRTVVDNCFVVDSPSQRFCKTTLSFEGQTQIKFNGAYQLPYGVMLSGVFQLLPGAPIQANYRATKAETAPRRGRSLGQCGGVSVGCTGSVSVPLIEPNPVFEARLSQVDLRLEKTISLGAKTRLQGT